MECKPAASSTTPTSSCERIIAEFEANGRPAGNGTVGAEVLGGYEILTPRVGTGFVEWAVSGYDLEGKHKNAPEGVDYNKSGDWLYDKKYISIPDSPHDDDVNYREK
jgi:hypothetical protein